MWEVFDGRWFLFKNDGNAVPAEKESVVFAVVCVCECVQASGCACVSGKFVFEDLVWCACESLRSQKE